MQPGHRSRPNITDTVIGMQEVAQLLEVKRATVDQWRRRELLPTPDYDLQGGPVWWRSTIVQWARRTGRV